MRVPGWQVALADVLHDAGHRPFRWGRHDCCQFVARAAAAVTGEDGRKRFPKYRNKAEALAIVDDCGDLRGLLTRAFGDPIHPSRASLGDVVLLETSDGQFPGVCMGVSSFAPDARCLRAFPTRFAVCAWSV